MTRLQTDSTAGLRVAAETAAERIVHRCRRELSKILADQILEWFDQPPVVGPRPIYPRRATRQLIATLLAASGRQAAQEAAGLAERSTPAMEGQGGAGSSGGDLTPLEALRRREVIRALQHSEENVARAARALGVGVKTFYNWRRQYDVGVDDLSTTPLPKIVRRWRTTEAKAARQALLIHEGNMAATARYLGISTKKLHNIVGGLSCRPQAENPQESS